MTVSGQISCPPAGSYVAVSGQSPVAADSFNDIATTHLQLAAEFHPNRNGALTPQSLVAGSHTKVWWRCSEGHEWYTSPNSRTHSGPTVTPCGTCEYLSRDQTSSRQERELAQALATLMPWVQHSVALEIEGFVYHLDMVSDVDRLIVEFDGSYWHRNRARTDRRKSAVLRRRGWTVIRIREEPLEALHPDDVTVPFLCDPAEAARRVAARFSEISSLDGVA